MIGVILVKGISGRLPGKNFMGFDGLPLWRANYDKMVRLGLRVCVITDEASHDVVDAEWKVMRPKWIADNSQLVLDWFVEEHGIKDSIMLMQATNPLVDYCFMELCKDSFETAKFQALVSINPATCERDGSLYITRTGTLYGSDMWVAFRGDLNPMACDIDEYPDYCIAKAIHEKRVISFALDRGE